MAKSDVYFQFPIRALNLGDKLDEVAIQTARIRHQDIFCYCLVNFGKQTFAKNERGNLLLARQYSSSFKIACDLENRHHAEILYACWYFRKPLIGSIEYMLRCYDSICRLPGGNMQVRLREDLFLDSTAMGWREWSILCGVYAMLGGRSKVRISYKQMNALALGFDGVSKIPPVDLNALRMSDRQTQITVQRLVDRKLFSKASVNGRHNWYSFQPRCVLERNLVMEQAKKLLREHEEKSSERTKAMRQGVLETLEALKRDLGRREIGRANMQQARNP
jgi:hypothetical protein